MALSDRIKQLLETEGITRAQFARDCELSQTGATKLYTGENKASKRTIAVICERYKVNRSWLEDGIGEMYVKEPESDDIQDAIDEILLGVENPLYDSIRAILAAYSKLPDEKKQTVLEFARNISQERANKKEPDS